jgi:hypothetical protein
MFVVNDMVYAFITYCVVSFCAWFSFLPIPFALSSYHLRTIFAIVLVYLALAGARKCETGTKKVYSFWLFICLINRQKVNASRCFVNCDVFTSLIGQILLF